MAGPEPEEHETRIPDPEKEIKARIDGEKIRQAALQRIQKELLGSVNIYTVVLLLLATVTFGAFLAAPGRTNQDTGSMQSYLGVKFFIIFISSSFYLAVAGLLLCVCSSLSTLASINTLEEYLIGPHAPCGGHMTSLQHMRTTTHQLSRSLCSTLLKLVCVSVLFTISLVCCMAAFIAIGFAMTDYHMDKGGRMSMVVTSIVGLLFVGIFMVWLFRDTRRFVMKTLLSDQHLTFLQSIYQLSTDLLDFKPKTH